MTNNENTTKRSIQDFARMSTLRPDEIDEDEDIVDDIDEECEDGSEEYRSFKFEEERDKEEDPAKARLVHSEPCYRVAARPSADDYFRFMFSHTYLNVFGIVATLLGIASIVFFVLSLFGENRNMMQTVLFGVVIVLFVSNSPVSLYFKSKKQAELATIDENVIHYAFSDNGFDMARGADYAKHQWEDIFKVKEGKTGYYVYLSKNQAFLLPKSNLVEMEADLRNLLTEKVEAGKLKFIVK